MRSWLLALALIAAPAFAQDYGSGVAMVYQRPPASGVTAYWESDFEEASGCGDGTTGDDMTITLGSDPNPDCDYTGVVPEGSESLLIDSDTNASNQFVAINPKPTNVTSGTIWIDFYLRVAADTSSGRQDFVQTNMDGGLNGGIDITTQFNRLGVQCDDGTFGDSSNNVYSIGTTYNVRLVVDIDNDDMELFVDTSGWGVTSEATCNGTGGASPGWDDITLVGLANVADYVFDAIGVCTTDPGSSKCGD